jgi:beta-barrel assembly-enhancing protease
MRLWCIALVCFLLIVSKNASAKEEDEKGLLMLADKHELQLRTSSARSNNKVMEKYIRDMTCRIAAENCSKIRVYLLRAPGLNAFMMPNGAMFVQTGLILRLTSDSELASVIGHEIVHYTELHSLKRARTTKRAQQVGNLFSIGLQVGGAGAMESSLLLNSIAGAYLSAYSRDAERESDEKGLRLSNNAGYDPTLASRIWENFKNEREVSGYSGVSLFASHPAIDERMSSLNATASALSVSRPTGIGVDEGGLLRIVDDFRLDFLNDEMQSMSPKQFEILLSNQIKFSTIPDGLASYLSANAWMYSTKQKGANKNNLQKAYKNADSYYEKGMESESGMPSSGYREWAKLNEKLGDNCRAKKAYLKYLLKEPDAWDAKFVSKRLEKLDCVANRLSQQDSLKEKVTKTQVPKIISSPAEKKSTKIDSFEKASSKCLALGFKKETDSFGKCVLELAAVN